jgi:biopolymer transport protein ExbD
MPPKTLFMVGSVAMLLAVLVFSISAYWMGTRTFEPVDMSIRLDQGKIQSGVFKINLRETFYVSVQLDYSIDDYYKDGCNFKNLFGAQWKLYRQIADSPKPQLVASWEDNDKQSSHVGDFAVDPGNYQLEWQGPVGAACLNARHPRLNVRTDRGGYETAFGFVLLACWILVWVGSGTILRAVVVWLSEVLGTSRAPRMFPDMVVTSVIPPRQHRPMPLMKDFPNFGLVHGFILWVLMFLFMILRPGPSSGVKVDFKEEHTVIVEKNPWAETMAVYVDAKRGLLVNGKPVAREELRSKLQEELLRRGVWVVYFEADGDCLYMDAVYAMDTIQGLGAKTIWITPKTREEWKKSTIPRHSDRTNRIP